MRVVPISSPERWQAFAAPWNLLTHGVPFRGWEWLSTWWRHYGAGRELAVLAVVDDCGTIVGAAPWYVEHIGSRGRVLRTLGAGEVCSDYATVLCTPDFEHQVSAVLAQWLVGASESLRWDVLELECVSASDSAITKLVEHLESAGCSLLRTPGENLWSVPLPATWEEYLMRLSKSHRKQIQRLLRGQCDTGRARLVTVQDETQVRRGMELLVELHQRRWQLAGKPGVFASESFSKFLHDVAGQLLQVQALQLSVLELDGRPAAVDFHLVNSAANFVYQGGFEPQLADQSPGKLLTALLIKEAIASGRRTFDFLRGDEPYKSHFRALPTGTINLHVVPKRAAAQLRHGLWMTGVAVRNLVKSGMSLTGIH